MTYSDEQIDRIFEVLQLLAKPMMQDRRLVIAMQKLMSTLTPYSLGTGDALDAMRYRYIRDQASKFPQDFEPVCDAAFTSTHGDSHNFDMNIDDQIAAIKGKSHD